jgi:hypothetical protein
VFREILTFCTTRADDSFALKIILVEEFFGFLFANMLTAARAILDEKISIAYHNNA